MLKAKILGKPYAGKLHVRFDEGEEEAKVSKCGLTLYRLPSSFLLYWPNSLLLKLWRRLPHWKLKTKTNINYIAIRTFMVRIVQPHHH
jgi:hypothetical protein